MKITKEQLKQIIKEELQVVLNESAFDRKRDRMAMRGTWKSYKRRMTPKLSFTQKLKKQEDMIKKYWKQYAAENKEDLTAQGFLDYLAIDPEVQQVAQNGFDYERVSYFHKLGIWQLER
tara:strand:- start:465 stop:821 length:357 start_codon:yes stop_codon:yes gene_type:complete